MLHPFCLGKSSDIWLRSDWKLPKSSKRSCLQIAPNGVFRKAILREKVAWVTTCTTATEGARDGMVQATEPREDSKRND